jgi:hypothetical protein
MALVYRCYPEEPSASDIILEVLLNPKGKCSYCGNKIESDHIQKYHSWVNDEVISSLRYYGRPPIKPIKSVEKQQS